MSVKVSQSTLQASTHIFSLLLVVLGLLVFSGSSVDSSAVRLFLAFVGGILIKSRSCLVAVVMEHMLIGRQDSRSLQVVLSPLNFTRQKQRASHLVFLELDHKILFKKIGLPTRKESYKPNHKSGLLALCVPQARKTSRRLFGLVGDSSYGQDNLETLTPGFVRSSHCLNTGAEFFWMCSLHLYLCCLMHQQSKQ